MTEKEHKNVLADIRKMLNKLEKAEAEFSATAFVDGSNNSKCKIIYKPIFGATAAKLKAQKGLAKKDSLKRCHEWRRINRFRLCGNSR